MPSVPRKLPVSRLEGPRSRGRNNGMYNAGVSQPHSERLNGIRHGTGVELQEGFKSPLTQERFRSHVDLPLVNYRSDRVRDCPDVNSDSK